MSARRIPKLCRHRASGQGVVRLDGKDHYLGAYGTPECQAAYDRLIADWLVRQRRGPVPGVGGTGLTVAGLLAAYLEDARRRVREHGRCPKQLHRLARTVADVRAARLDGRPLEGLPAADFGPRALAAVRERMAARHNRRHTNQRVALLKAAWRWAAAAELVPAEAAARVWALPPLRPGEAAEPEPVRPVPVRDLALTLRALPAVVADLCRLQYLTGMRPGEAVQLRPCDVDRSGRDPDGARHPGCWVYVVPKHKTRRYGRRVILLGPRAQRLLAPYLEGRPAAQPAFSPAESFGRFIAARVAGRLARGLPSQSKGPPPPRKSRNPGRQYATSSYARRVTQAAARAGVPHWHPHQLRHLRATQIRGRFTPDHARVVLGHKLPGITGLYAEGDLRKAAEVMRAIG